MICFGHTFTVGNGQCNEFITVVDVKSKVKKHNIFQWFHNLLTDTVVASITTNKLRFHCFVLDI